MPNQKPNRKARRCKGGCTYSRRLDQPYPRLCIQCGQPEPAGEECPHTMLAEEPDGTILCCDCCLLFSDMAAVEAARAAMEEGANV